VWRRKALGFDLTLKIFYFHDNNKDFQLGKIQEAAKMAGASIPKNHATTFIGLIAEKHYALPPVRSLLINCLTKKLFSNCRC